MKGAVTRNSSETFERDLVRNIGLDIVQDAAEPNRIETIRGGLGGRACPAVAMLLQESGRQHQRRGFDVHAACSRLDRKLGEDRTANVIDDIVADAHSQTDGTGWRVWEIEIVLQAIE